MGHSGTAAGSHSAYDTASRLRIQLGIFLRAKRNRLDPAEYGLARMGRRRTSGLRREEVAELADVGPTWYTWLEQGRNGRPSARVLESVARVLRLTPAEIDLLFALAGHHPARRAAPDAFDAAVLQDMVDRFTVPACVRDERFDVLATNAACAALFTIPLRAEPHDRNLVRRLFRPAPPGDEPFGAAFARRSVADMRASYARSVAPAELEALVNELRGESRSFAAWWDEYPVDEPAAIDATVVHPHAGRLELRFSQFRLAERGGLTLLVVTPKAGDERSALRLRHVGEPPAERPSENRSTGGTV